MNRAIWLLPAILALLASGCVGSTAFVPSGDMPAWQGSVIERRAANEQVRETYGEDGYSLEVNEPRVKYRWSQIGGPDSDHDEEAGRFFEQLSRLAVRLDQELGKSGHAGQQMVLLPTTFVNLDDLDKTSTFGRLAAEQLAAELKSRRYQVVELRLADEVVIIPTHGEINLSRHIEELAESYSANAVLVGTYVITAQEVILNVRLVKTADRLLAAAGSAVFNRRDNLFVNSLLVRETRAAQGRPLSQAMDARSPRVRVGVSGQFQEKTLKK